MNKVFILTPISLKESSLHLTVSLVETLKSRPNLMSKREIFDSIELSTTQTRKQNINRLAVGVILIPFILSHTSSRNHISHILSDFPNPCSPTI